MNEFSKGSQREQKTSEVLIEGYVLESTLIKDESEPKKAVLITLPE